MTAWRALFEIAVVHGFFAPGRCEGLRLEPSRPTLDWLARCGALLRPGADGIAVLHDDPARAAAATRPGSVFELWLSSRDPWFAVYTDGLLDGGIACLELEPQAAADASGAISAGPVSPASAWPAGRPTPPLLLRIGLGPWLCAAPRRWRVTLAPRTTHWRYLLPAEWAAQQPAVVDLAAVDPVDFEPVSTTTLGDGRAALTTHSRRAIPLAARPSQRFVLRAMAPLADPVLVRRLPVASAGQFGMETIAGARTLVSEIYVNR